MSWFTNIVSSVFGSSNNGKSAIEVAATTYERINPGEVKKHEMSIEDLQVGDESQASARSLEFTSHDSWFDIFVDGVNRLVRPSLSVWAMGMLFGWWDTTRHWEAIPPMAWNIIWTIVTFYFGARMIFKDIPSAIRIWKK